MPRLNTDVNILFYPTIAAACSAFFFLILFLVLWVIFSTTTSSFTVTSVIVSKFNIITTHSTKSELTATFNVEGILENPNLVLWFDNFTIASAPIRQPPFSTQAQTITPVQAQFAMARRPLPSGLASEITAERNYHGSVDFGATLVAGFRYKFGVLHSKVRHFKLDCHPLHVALHANETIGKLVAPVDCKIV